MLAEQKIISSLALFVSLMPWPGSGPSLAPDQPQVVRVFQADVQANQMTRLAPIRCAADLAQINGHGQAFEAAPRVA